MSEDVYLKEKIGSMENVYQKLLKQGFCATINDNNDFNSCYILTNQNSSFLK